MPGRRVLLVYSHDSSFVQNDHAILDEAFEVEPFQLEWKPQIGRRMQETHQALWRAIRRNDQVYWWFLSDYCALGALYAKTLRKRFVAVAGGWDVAAEDKVAYGRLVSGMRPKLGTKAALKLADLVLTVSPFNDAETAWAGRKGARQVVPNGVDVSRFRPRPSRPATGRPKVVAVGALTKHNLAVKGQWVFAEASRLVPEADFIMIGSADPQVRAELEARGGENLDIAGFVPDEAMVALLQEAAVVCQLSWHESFGMGLVEAVSCGCAPVYSAERIGAAAYLEGLGHTVPYGDVEAAARAVRTALEDAKAPGFRARAHDVIRRNVPLERRRAALLRLMAPGWEPQARCVESHVTV